MKRVVLVGIILAALGLASCGSSGSKSPTAPGSPVVATPDTEYADAPKITEALVAEWPTRWCKARVGDSREEVARIMGSYPTTEDSGKIPLIPHISANANGEYESNSPPMPAGSDTWEAPGSYQFNAFFDTSLHVQQLDFNGPARELGCAMIRVGQ